MTISGVLTGGGANGRPVHKPYRWRGDPRDAEVRAQLTVLRARLAYDVDGGCPTPGDYREAADVPFPEPPPLPRLTIVPFSASGRRRPQPAIVPPSLAARLTAMRQPPAPTAAKRCRRCGYLPAKCPCPHRRAS